MRHFLAIADVSRAISTAGHRGDGRVLLNSAAEGDGNANHLFKPNAGRGTLARARSAVPHGAVARLARSAGATFIAVALIGPTAAQAQTTAVAGGSPANISLAIPVTASIASRCIFSVSGTYDVPEITVGFAHDFDIALRCSSPVRVGVISANGGLLAAIATPPTGYGRLAPYDVALSLVGNSGVPTATGACAAATLTTATSAPCTFRGPASATQGLRLGGPSTAASGSTLRVSAPVYAGSEILLASATYADTLTLTVSATI